MGEEGAMGVHTGIAQAERREDVLFQETRECLSGHLFDDVGQQHVSGVAVAPFRARAEL